MHRQIARVLLAASVLAGVVMGFAPSALASIIHVNCPGQNLQSKVNGAAPNSTLLIKGTCYGTVLVAQPLTLKGNPAGTLDGNDGGTVLTIGANVSVHLEGLTITGGFSSQGGGILNGGTGTLSLDTVTVENNVAEGSNAQGGGIYSGSSTGSVEVTNSSIVNNRAIGAGSNPQANGAGIYSASPLTVVGSTVGSNRASAHTGSPQATGGGIFASGSSLLIRSSHVDANHVTSSGTTGANAVGGAILYGDPGGSLSVTGSTLNANVVQASTTGNGASASGGGIQGSFDSATIRGDTFSGNRLTASSPSAAAVVGGGLSTQAATKLSFASSKVTGSVLKSVSTGAEATGEGAGIWNLGPLSIVSSVISGGTINAQGATSANETAGQGGGVLEEVGTLSVRRSTVSGNHLIASSTGSNTLTQGGGIFSNGGNTSIVGSTISGNTVGSTATTPHGAFGTGAGVFFGGGTGTLDDTITNSTIAGNVAQAHSDAQAVALGGGAFTGGSAVNLTLIATTMARNVVKGSGSPLTVTGGGLDVGTGAASIGNTIIALNSAPNDVSGPDCFGTVATTGHNLIGNSGGCTITFKTSDKHDVNPKLGLLANNGGPTQTVALQKGSPAIDAIPPAACKVKTDQRGFKRPQGPRCDIGAYEKTV